MSDSSTLFIKENEEVPDCPHQPFLPDSSDSDNDSDVDMEKHSSPEIVEDDSGGETVYCICRNTARGFMVGCDGNCEDWFHGDCVGIEAKKKDLLNQFVCPKCTADGHGVTLWEDATADVDSNAMEYDQVLADSSNGEDNIVVSRSNKLLRQNLISRKQASQPPQTAAATHKKYIGRSRLHAQPVPKHHGQASPAVAASTRMPIARKLQYSLPTFENRPPGFRTRHKNNRDDDNGGGEMDDEVDTNARGRATKLSATPSAGSRVNKPMAKIHRRSYVDVEEAPTSVDLIVKNCLKEALFGAQDG